MELFFVGFGFGAVAMLVIFVVWNWQRPDTLDKAEASVRTLTDEYDAAKAKVKAKLKRSEESK